MADLGHVFVTRFDEHSVEWIDAAAAGVALHQATWDEPALVGEGERNTTVTLLHRISAAIGAVLVLSV